MPNGLGSCYHATLPASTTQPGACTATPPLGRGEGGRRLADRHISGSNPPPFP